MYAFELAEILLKNPDAEVKLAISDTTSPLCVNKEISEIDIEIEEVRGEKTIYLNHNFPIS